MAAASKRNQCKAFVSFDAMFSIIPILIIVLFTLNSVHYLASNAAERMHRQTVMDKLVSAADYVVKQAGAVEGRIGNTDVRYPNWIDSDKINHALESDLEKKTGLKNVSIRITDSLDDQGAGDCVYRIVVVDIAKKISAVHVCGD